MLYGETGKYETEETTTKHIMIIVAVAHRHDRITSTCHCHQRCKKSLACGLGIRKTLLILPTLESSCFPDWWKRLKVDGFWPT